VLLRNSLASYITGAILLISSIAFAISEFSLKRMPSRVSYSNEIVPLLTRNCNGCHSGSHASGDLDFTSYDAVYISVISRTIIDSSGNLPKCCSQINLSGDVRHELQQWISEGALFN